MFILHELCLSTRRMMSDEKKKKKRNNVSSVYLKVKRHQRKRKIDFISLQTLQSSHKSIYPSTMWKPLHYAFDTDVSIEKLLRIDFH